jgi:hypothetical protein
VSLPRLVIAFITVGLLALLTLPLTEGLLKLHGASLIIFVAGTFTIIGGALGLWGAIRNNAEQADLILGDKDTFCQLIVYHDAAVGWYLSTYHAGSGGAIYDVQVLIGEVRDDGTPVYKRERRVLGTLTSTTWPWDLLVLGFGASLPPNRVVDPTPRYFEAQVTQRNGTSMQDIVIYPQPDGSVRSGFLRLTFNGQSREPDFKLLPAFAAKGITVSPAEVARLAVLRGWR